ncbi:hypothetical protein FAES_3587 [Fibrella aestuarina BUZ 2]|uniref:Uncharacterized protein n=1 Tax=Fibrella aestuarina BUZ 2 TaxID=1166018 RepID=I0KBU1_9BACT|nr:hypothetical protein [Fibrella aestuarina]CCH01594.1 hypothetical protein FAES_3587 [Fibrella aestuarina BUZ 2]
MKKLARHSLYLALFMGALLTVAGLSLYRELPVFMVLATVIAILAGMSLLAWAFFTLAGRSSATRSTRQPDVPKSSGAMSESSSY